MSESLKGKYIAFTGKLQDFTRADLENMGKEYGFTFMSRVSATTDILVVGDKPGKTKLDKARSSGVREMSGDDFIFMLGADDALGIKAPPTVETEEEIAERQAFYENDDYAGIF